MYNDINEQTQMRRVPIRVNKRKRHPQNKNNFSKIILVIALFCICIFSFLNYRAKMANSNISPIDLNFTFSPHRQNILIMGVDVAANSQNPFLGNRSDTMLLVSIAPYGKNINVISIPRDSKVYLSGKNKVDKINHAFAFGGAKLAVRTVEDTFGVKIDNYLAISNKGIIEVIDTLGGLPIYIEKNMKYDDYSAKLHINLKQGNQILTGKETEGYLRFRHDSYGDIGRIKRQQWFFNALMARLKDPAVIVKLPELLKIMPQYIETDLSAYDLAKYAGLAKNTDISSIQTATIPGAPSTKGIISYWIINPEKTQELINKLVYRNKSYVDAKDLSINILYANSKLQNANILRNELETKGFQVKMRESDNASKDYIAIHNLDVAGDIIADLKRTIPEIKDKQTIYDPMSLSQAGKDITIVISGL